MIKLNDEFVAFDQNESTDDIQFVDFNLKNKYKNNTNFALKIDFKNNKKYSIMCLKKLLYFEKNNINFFTYFKNLKVKYIILNYNDEIIDALKAIFIKNIKNKYEFIYDNIFDKLDKIWKEKNPCDFCQNICISSRNSRFNSREDGCCYSFEYTKNPFSISPIKSEKKCQYLGSDKICTTRNLSCKFFVCKYLKKNNIFNLKMNNFLLISVFFNKKQKLILKYNYFCSKEEIISKLLEKNNLNLFFYYLFHQYRIL